MADDHNVTVFKQLYSKIAEALSIGTPTAVPGQNYLALCNPGILLDPKLNVGGEVAAQYTWARVLDNVPEPNWVYTPTNISIASIYQQVLAGKELPNIGLTKEQQEKLASAQAVVMTPEHRPNATYKAYMEYRGEYLQALTAYQTAQTTAANTGQPMPVGLQETLNLARSNWNTFGSKGQVEAAQATITNLLQLDPNTWWAQLQNAYENTSVTPPGGSPFEPSSTYPAYNWFTGNEGWTSFGFTQQDVTSQATASAVQAGGGVSAGWGLWRVSGSADYSKATTTSSSDTTGISVSMDIMRATIMRPWLDPLVFRAHSWRFGKASQLYGAQISNGTFTPGEANGGLMPLLPTGVLVARNVKIAAQFSHEDQTTVEKALSTNASVGWGPFAINGHYSQSESSAVSHGSATATTIGNPDPQILGFFCDVLPLCPSPDPTLPWPASN